MKDTIKLNYGIFSKHHNLQEENRNHSIPRPHSSCSWQLENACIGLQFGCSLGQHLESFNMNTKDFFAKSGEGMMSLSL